MSLTADCCCIFVEAISSSQAACTLRIHITTKICPTRAQPSSRSKLLTNTQRKTKKNSVPANWFYPSSAAPGGNQPTLQVGSNPNPKPTDRPQASDYDRTGANNQKQRNEKTTTTRNKKRQTGLPINTTTTHLQEWVGINTIRFDSAYAANIILILSSLC